MITSNGKYLTAESGGGINGDPARGPAREDALICDRTDADIAQYGNAWQAFEVIRNSDGMVSLKIGEWYVTAERGGGSYVSTDRTTNEAWQRFTLVDRGGGMASLRSINGMSYLRVKPGTRALVDCAGTDADNERVVFTGLVPHDSGMVVRLRGRDFVDVNGQRMVYCGADLSRALVDFAAYGSAALSPVITQLRDVGTFNCLRVFFMGSKQQNQNFDCDPRTYYSAMRPLVEYLNGNGFVPLVVVNADAQDVMPSAHDRILNWQRVDLELEGLAWLASYANEADKNGPIDPQEATPLDGVVWSRGSWTIDKGEHEGPPASNGAPMSEYHSRRDMPKVMDDATASSTTLAERGYPLLFMDEPPRVGTDGNDSVYLDPMVSWRLARHYATEWGGAILHTRAGQNGTPFNDVDLAIAHAWARGMTL